MVLTVLLAAVALAGPAMAAGVDRLVAPPVQVVLEFVTPTGCMALPEPHEQARQRFACDGLSALASAELFSPRTASGPVRDWVKQATVAPGASDSKTAQLHIAGPPPLTWIRVETDPPFRAVALLVWMNGHPAASGWRDRVMQSWHNVVGGGTAPVVVSITIDTGRPASSTDTDRARRVQQKFLEAQSALPEQLARLASAVQVR